MTASILGLGTALPPTRLAQRDVRDLLAAQPGIDRRAGRIIGAAFDAAAIDTRHTVLAGLADPEAEGLRIREGLTVLSPSTAERSKAYRDAAPPLFAAASRAALTAAGVAPADVTHVITVSCTGMFAPGPDFLLVRDLGLSPTVERYHLGFIGCAAAVPGLRAAERIARADPFAVVLVAAAELCSLHIRVSDDTDQIIAASVFADGAAAAVVSADPARATGRRLELDDFATRLTGDGEHDMVWTVGDAGFEMTLTPAVPRIVGREIAGVVDDVFGGPDGIDAWAVHPGGRSILDRIDAALNLDPEALALSREVLREHGNMSSATLLFILERLLADDTRVDGERVGAIAFGPGLTVESARMTVRDAARRPSAAAAAEPVLALR